MLRLLPKSGLTAVVKKINVKNHIFVDKTALEQSESVRSRLYRFQYVTTVLSQAATQEEIAKIIVNLGAATLQACGGLVFLLDKNKTLYLAAQSGFTPEQIARIQKNIAGKNTPSWDAILYKKPIFLHTKEEQKRLYPHIVGSLANGEKEESSIAIPLLIANTVLGVVSFSFGKDHTLSVDEQEFMYALIQECTQALDRARLYDEESKKTQELHTVVARMSALYNTSSALSKALTLEEMANIVIGIGRKELGAFGGEIVLLSEDKEKMRVIASQGYADLASKGDEKDWREIPTNQSLLMVDAMESQKIVFVPDYTEIPKKYRLARKFSQATLADVYVLIPFVTEEGIKGTFALFFHKPKEVKEEDKEFLKALAHQFSQAYERARLYEQEKSQREKLEQLIGRITTLQEVTRLLSSALTSEKVSEIVLKQGVEAMGAIGGEVALLNDDHTKFKIVAYRGYPKEYTKNFNKEWQEILHIEPMLMWDAVRDKKSIFLPDIMDLPDSYKKGKAFAKLTNAKSSATIPLMVDSKPFGTFFLLFREKVMFSNEERNFITTLAQHASQALERSRIYEREKQIQEELRESEESSKQLIEAIPQLVWTGDENGRSIYWNHRWEEYTGIPQKKMTADIYWNNILHPDDKTAAESLWNKSLREKKPYQIEYRLLNKQGEYRWFLSKALPLKDRKRHVLRWFGTETDIHEQKMVTQEIERRESRFRSLIENSSDAIVLMDANGKILYSSPSTTRITGFTPEERLGASIFKSIYPKDKEKVVNFIRELSESSGDRLITIQYRRINKDGSIPWIEAVGRNMLHNPNVGALVVNYRNITEQVEAEHIIRQAKDELEVIFENVADAIVVRGPNGHILYCNQAAAMLNKYASVEEYLDDISYHNYLSRFEARYDEDGKELSETELPVARVLHEKRPVEQIMRVVFREDHTEQWRRVKSSPILDSQGNVQLVVTVLQDISAEKQQEKTKDEFISTASHELKTPITSAKLYSGILSQKLQEMGDEKTYSMITKLDQQLDRLTKLINDLLDVSKIKAGKILFTKTNVEIESLVKDVVEEMQYTTVSHQLIFYGGSKKVLSLDEERMRQVLINLISNAIKYSPNADRVDISLCDNNVGVTICVQDYGVGIEKKEQEKIFEPFYRTVLGKFPGLGLGLHISSEIVKRLGGKLSVESTPGRGTRMCVLLPDRQKKL